ncbi:MAG: sigma-54-dependent Fis family transcriptional regulator [Acidobacteria bacterium]|nr:sigma-54-dependent Fis family transcriptional regulator [Acidobacteriota bacterium]
MALILVVDDEAGIRELLRAVLRADSHRVLVTGSGVEALAILGRESVDLLITDLAMPEMDGVELLRRASQASPETTAIVITAFGSKETAIEAMRHGAVNYLEKPFHVEEMRLHVRNALGHRRLSDENRRLRERLSTHGEIIGRSPVIEEVRALVRRVADADSSVLITGDSGTGKEIVARAIHAGSPRVDRPFVGINCAAIPAELLESELFGHVRGAFTGADRSRRGLVEAAEGGTLFLDEIGDMSPAMQVKLLRVLQDRKIRKVGGTEEIPVDVRLLTATHRDLDAMVRSGSFREDLYYRIHVIRIHVPPLRERLEDIPEFVRFFARKHAQRMGREVGQAEPAFLEALARYSWPGNVRELENVVERAVALSTGERLTVDTLPPELFERSSGHGPRLRLPEKLDLEAHLLQERSRFMEAALEASGGVQARAAERLGMSFRSFRYFAKKFGLVRDAEPAEVAD